MHSSPRRGTTEKAAGAAQYGDPDRPARAALGRSAVARAGAAGEMATSARNFSRRLNKWVGGILIRAGSAPNAACSSRKRLARARGFSMDRPLPRTTRAFSGGLGCARGVGMCVPRSWSGAPRVRSLWVSLLGVASRYPCLLPAAGLLGVAVWLCLMELL